MRGEKVILFTKSSAHTEFLRRLISLSIWDYRQNIVFWDLLVICDHTALAKVNESNIFSIFRDFILLSEARALNLDQPVDKKEAFLPVFVYCPSRFKVDYGQIVDSWKLPVKHSLVYGQKAAFWDLPVNACRPSKILQNQETSRRQFLHRHWIYKKVIKLGLHVQMKPLWLQKQKHTLAFSQFLST